ncbi:hypothetical protein H480_42225 [Amycolatopsis vancoresmycina DSM 44592]|uniref:Uncharacterized protein n=1 Tax=Amycolatopsis vancoresmycina DSM 44592 TaxID=1292037 RepID=R1H5U5_9PSEU|nr:hypothetical protein H480_42225 [Amycolatopsis vancoresmycina DSM 44592]
MLLRETSAETPASTASSTAKLTCPSSAAPYSCSCEAASCSSHVSSSASMPLRSLGGKSRGTVTIQVLRKPATV